MGELKSCPFCGGEASPNGVVRRSKSPDLRWLDGTECLEAFYCNCMSCGVNNGGAAGGYQTREKAIAKWNTRTVFALTPAQQAAEEMAGVLNRLRDTVHYWDENPRPDEWILQEWARKWVRILDELLAKAGKP